MSSELVSMYEFYRIKEAAGALLSNAGFVEESEDPEPDCFGSIHALFSRAGEKVRLVWNGKDGCGFAQILRGSEDQTRGRWLLSLRNRMELRDLRNQRPRVFPLRNQRPRVFP